MEEELKRKYNDLLESYQKGTKYLEEKPEDEKAQNRLLELAQEMENIAKSIPGITEKEIQEGFDLQGAKSEENVPKEKQGAQMQVIAKTQNNSLQEFSNNWEVAQKLCKSSIIPKEFQGKPENVLLCMGMSEKMGLDLITVMNNLQLVMGRQEWKGSFIPVLIEKTGKYYDLDFVFVGKENSDDWGCYLEATRSRDGKRIKGTTITINMVKAEGWYNRNAKWKTMPQQMLIYRAASFFARAYCAEALSGISTEGESNDINNREQPKDIL